MNQVDALKGQSLQTISAILAMNTQKTGEAIKNNNPNQANSIFISK